MTVVLAGKEIATKIAEQFLRENNLLTEEKIDSSMSSYYYECSDINGLNNYRKSMCLHRSTIALIITVIFLTLSFIPFSMKYFLNPNPQKMGAVNLEKEDINMFDDEKEEDRNQKPESMPPEPEKPPIRKFHEGEEVSE